MEYYILCITTASIAYVVVAGQALVNVH